MVTGLAFQMRSSATVIEIVLGALARTNHSAPSSFHRVAQMNSFVEPWMGNASDSFEFVTGFKTVLVVEPMKQTAVEF